MNAKSAITVFYEEIWNQRNKSRIPDICLEDFSFRGSVGQTKRGHAGFAEYVDLITEALGDYRCDIQDIVAEGDKAFAKMLFSGIHRGEFLGYAPTQISKCSSVTLAICFEDFSC